MEIFKLQQGETIAWRIIKIPLMLIWIPLIHSILTTYSSITLPVGFCRLFPCSIIAYAGFRTLIAILMYFFAALYVLEYQMKWATLGVSIIALLVFSIEESNGVYSRTAIFSAIFCVQTLAYWFTLKPIQQALAFSKQIIAAGYTLAGISKVLHSGFWPAGAPYLLLQFKKGILNNYYNVGSIDAVQHQVFFLGYFSEHQTLLMVLLTGVLLLKLFAFVALINAKAIIIYGLLLFAMHIGIQMTMDIFLYPISLPMLILFLNPFYNLPRLLNGAYKRFIK